MLEKIIFNVIAISLFIVVFGKIIFKNDTNYIGILVIQLIGISICFFELNLGIDANAFFFILRCILAIVIPLLIIFLEFKGTNFSEIISIVRAHIYFTLGNNKKAKEVLVELVNKYENT